MFNFNGFLRESRVLFLGPFCFGAAQIMLFTLLPVLQDKTSLSYSTLIIGLSLGTICFLPGTFFWNKQSDEGKSKRSLIVNSAALSLSVFTLVVLLQFSFSSSWALFIFLIGRIIWGLGASGIVGLSLFQQSQNEKHQVKAFAGNSLALNSGRLLGTTFILLPFAVNHIVSGFFVFTLLCLLLQFSVKNVSGKYSEDYSLSYHAKILMPAMMLVFLMTLIMGLVHSGLGSFIQDKFLITGTEAAKLTGVLMMTGTIVMMAGLFVTRKFQDSRWKTLILSGMIAMCTGLLLLNLSVTKPLFFVSVSLICLGVSFLHPGTLLFMTKLISGRDKGKTLGLMSLISTLGSAAGGILLSLSPDQFSNFVIGLALVLAFTSYVLIYRHDRKEVLWKV